MPQDYGKIHRLMRMLLLMQQGKAGNAAQLAQTLDVTERTVYRDLRILEDLGVPSYLDEATGGYRIRRDFFLPAVHLTASEALALLSLGPIGESQQIAMTKPAALALEKIRGQLPTAVIEELGDLSDHIDIQLPASGPASESIADVFTRIQQAIRQRRVLRCCYESLRSDSDGDAPFEFHPYVLTFEQRAWYAVGHHAGRKAIRRLKLNRFTQTTPTDIPYVIPDDFSLATHRGQAWRMMRGDKLYHIVIEFSAEVAETVADTHWHPTQDVEDHEDGSITYTCDVEGLDEIVWWVLSYGPHARVREPAEMADRVRQLAEDAAARYKT